MVTPRSARWTVRASDGTRRLIADLLAFAVVSLTAILVQKFLFPLEDYWIGIVGGLLVYGLAQWGLITKERISNLFSALDHGELRTADTLLPIIGPAAISGILVTFGAAPFAFVFPVLQLACLLHSCLSVIAARVLARLPEIAALRMGPRTRVWLGYVGVASLAYALAFFSQELYRPVDPLLAGDPAVRGVWFTVPVQPSDLFPAGYARLEDSVVDDLGRVFVASLGQALGMVEACDGPGLSLERSVPSPDPDSLIQPRYHYAVDSMCRNWLVSLRTFFWRIGLTGVFLLAAILGIGHFRDPFDFGILSLVLLAGWISWPQPAGIRMGNVAVLVAGMPLIALAVPLLRRARFSELFLWAVLSGLMFGMAGFVRRPCGQALIFAAIGILLLSGFRQQKKLLTLVASLALLAGSSVVPAAVNSLFVYRDAALHISAPGISPREHGSGFPLLGGIGGHYIPGPPEATPQYSNALDATFLDAAIWYLAYDANPMIGFARKSFSLMQQVSQQLFVRYVADHPLEFTSNVLRKTFDLLRLVFGVPAGWISVPLLLVLLLWLRRAIAHLGTTTPAAAQGGLTDVLVAFAMLMVFVAAPAILTAPGYGESEQLPAAVLFFALLVAAHSMVRSILHRPGPS